MAKAKWKLSLALALSSMLALCAVQAAQGAPPSTQVIRFSPRSPGRGLLTGYCWTGSIAIARPDAWRCMAGNQIFDPCFESKDKGFVACDPNPAEHDPGLRMKLTKPLPLQQANPASRQGAWLVELADGTACWQRTGAGWLVKGKAVNYYCKSRKKGVEIDLLGEFDTARPLWTVEKATFARGPRGLKLIKIDKAGVSRVWR